MIYTRFGNPCEIELAGLMDERGRIPVDIILLGQGPVSSSRKQTWAHELRADDGINEIMQAVKRALGAA